MGSEMCIRDSSIDWWLLETVFALFDVVYVWTKRHRAGPPRVRVEACRHGSGTSKRKGSPRVDKRTAKRGESSLASPSDRRDFAFDTYTYCCCVADVAVPFCFFETVLLYCCMILLGSKVIPILVSFGQVPGARYDYMMWFCYTFLLPFNVMLLVLCGNRY